MKINEKISQFLEDKKISLSEIGRRYGTTHQTISNYLNGNRALPLDFLVWLLSEFPDMDANKLLREDNTYFVADNRGEYGKKLTKKEALDIISRVMDDLIKP